MLCSGLNTIKYLERGNIYMQHIFNEKGERVYSQQEIDTIAKKSTQAVVRGRIVVPLAIAAIVLAYQIFTGLLSYLFH